MALFFYQFTPLYGHNQNKTCGYGQNVKNRDLPVKRDGRLRAKREKQGFARKSETCGYGQNVKNRDLPVKQDGRLRAKREKQGFARKTRRAVTGKT